MASEPRERRSHYLPKITADEDARLRSAAEAARLSKAAYVRGKLGLAPVPRGRPRLPPA